MRAILLRTSRHPHGWRGLKYIIIGYIMQEAKSPPAWVAWIEMENGLTGTNKVSVATRMGGVD